MGAHRIEADTDREPPGPGRQGRDGEAGMSGGGDGPLHVVGRPRCRRLGQDLGLGLAGRLQVGRHQRGRRRARDPGGDHERAGLGHPEAADPHGVHLAVGAVGVLVGEAERRAVGLRHEIHQIGGEVDGVHPVAVEPGGVLGERQERQDVGVGHGGHEDEGVGLVEVRQRVPHEREPPRREVAVHVEPVDHPRRADDDERDAHDHRDRAVPLPAGDERRRTEHDDRHRHRQVVLRPHEDRAVAHQRQAPVEEVAHREGHHEPE